MDNYDKYLYSRFNFSQEYKSELIEFIKHNTNAEIGGYRLFDGARTHLMQNPYELADFIFCLKKHEQENREKLSAFLDIGFAAGINNTILCKFFNFDEIVGVDLFSGETPGGVLKANMMNKNLTLICGDSTTQRVIDKVKSLGHYDLIFIDANHTYEYVKKDFYNYKPFLSKKGVIAFHDIDCPDWPGINRFWNELKESQEYGQQEFVCRGFRLQYGIGMLTIR